MFPSKYIKCANITTKRAEKSEFQTQHTNFGLGIRLLQEISQ